MVLPQSRFDGVFANASLFHEPSKELPRVLLELSEALRPRGVLFCSNPRGNNMEGFSGDRYCCFFDLDTWRNYVSAAGFFEVRHYYRPPGLPRRHRASKHRLTQAELCAAALCREQRGPRPCRRAGKDATGHHCGHRRSVCTEAMSSKMLQIRPLPRCTGLDRAP
jgi:hypothetical protein